MNHFDIKSIIIHEIYWCLNWGYSVESISYFFRSRQLRQYHFPFGAVVIFKQSIWNHWITHSVFSQKIISPCSPSLQMHQRRFFWALSTTADETSCCWGTSGVESLTLAIGSQCGRTGSGLTRTFTVGSQRCWPGSKFAFWNPSVLRRWQTGCGRFGLRRITSIATVLRRFRIGCGPSAIDFWRPKIIIARARARVTEKMFNFIMNKNSEWEKTNKISFTSHKFRWQCHFDACCRNDLVRLLNFLCA